jgi:hypothetical protein
MLYNSVSMWPSVVVHEHWPVSQRMIVEMGTTRGASTLSRHFWPVRLPSRTYNEAVQTIPWPAMSPDMNPIERVWDFIGRKINQRNPKCQNKMGTTRGASTLSRHFWPVRLPSRTYKSNLQSKEKQPQTVNPKCQNIDELRIAILQEWQQFPQERLRHLVRSMTRCVTELHNKGGG